MGTVNLIRLGRDLGRLMETLEQTAAQYHGWEAEYAEAVRRHERAVTVTCPYCGAAPGLTCRTVSPGAGGHPKGVHDHADRYRLTAGLLGGDAP